MKREYKVTIDTNTENVLTKFLGELVETAPNPEPNPEPPKDEKFVFGYNYSPAAPWRPTSGAHIELNHLSWTNKESNRYWQVPSAPIIEVTASAPLRFLDNVERVENIENDGDSSNHRYLVYPKHLDKGIVIDQGTDGIVKVISARQAGFSGEQEYLPEALDNLRGRWFRPMQMIGTNNYSPNRVVKASELAPAGDWNYTDPIDGGVSSSIESVVDLANDAGCVGIWINIPAQYNRGARAAVYSALKQFRGKVRIAVGNEITNTAMPWKKNHMYFRTAAEQYYSTGLPGIGKATVNAPFRGDVYGAALLTYAVVAGSIAQEAKEALGSDKVIGVMEFMTKDRWHLLEKGHILGYLGRETGFGALDEIAFNGYFGGEDTGVLLFKDKAPVTQVAEMLQGQCEELIEQIKEYREVFGAEGLGLSYYECGHHVVYESKKHGEAVEADESIVAKWDEFLNHPDTADVFKYFGDESKELINAGCIYSAAGTRWFDYGGRLECFGARPNFHEPFFKAFEPLHLLTR